MATPTLAQSYTVYVITNTANGKKYVGHAVNFQKRRNKHVFHLNRGDHHSQHMNRAWRKYGRESFTFTPVFVELPTLEDAIAVEQRLIDSLRVCDDRFGYNISPTASGNKGVKYSAESRARMSRAQKGRIISEEARRKIAATLKGRKPSREAIEKSVAKMRGVDRSGAWARHLSESQNRRSGALKLTAFGRSQYINDWAREFGMDFATLRNRVYRAGMTLEAALTTPIKRKRPKR